MLEQNLKGLANLQVCRNTRSYKFKWAAAAACDQQGSWLAFGPGAGMSLATAISLASKDADTQQKENTMLITRSDIQPDMEVIGSDEGYVGRVDHMDGANAIKLARKDKASNGRHHWIPLKWVESVSAGKLRLNISSSDAFEQWQDKSVS